MRGSYPSFLVYVVYMRGLTKYPLGVAIIICGASYVSTSITANGYIFVYNTSKISPINTIGLASIAWQTGDNTPMAFVGHRTGDVAVAKIYFVCRIIASIIFYADNQAQRIFTGFIG